jgi:hypothetical protein
MITVVGLNLLTLSNLSMVVIAQVRCALAETLLAQSKQEGARQHYLAALELVTGPEEHDQVQKALESLAPFA